MTNSDDRKIGELESKFSSLSEKLDGADIYSVLSMIADSQGDFMPDFLHSSLAKDLIRFTQSNPVEAFGILEELSELDNEIAELT